MVEEQTNQVRSTTRGKERAGASAREIPAGALPASDSTHSAGLGPPAAEAPAIVVTEYATSSDMAAGEQHSACNACCAGAQQASACRCWSGTHRAQHSDGARFVNRARSIVSRTARRIAPFYGSGNRGPASG